MNTSDPGTNYIYDVTSDKNGNVWLGTESGIMRYDPKLNKNNSKGSNKFKQIVLHKDAIFYSMYKNKAGEILVGSSYKSGKGYYRFHPDSLYDNRKFPPVVITGFKVHNKELQPDSSWQYKNAMQLNYNQNFFTFEFAALNYNDPSKNEYAYILEGLENEWVYSGNQRVANYTGVPPGGYVFRVKGSNNDGYWNEEGARIAITILAPPWKTLWAYMVYAFFGAGIIISIIWYNIKRQQLRQALAIEHVSKEKLEEMDRLKSRFFANISHEFRTPLTLILGLSEKLFGKAKDEESKSDLNVMQRNASRLQRLIDQLLNLSRIEAGRMKIKVKEEDLVLLVRGYFQFFESAARQKSIVLSFVSEGDAIFLYLDREKLEQILYNLFSNALKFTPEGGRIEVTVSGQRSAVSGQMINVNTENTTDRRLPTADLFTNCATISITDTGHGIQPTHLPHIFDRFYQADDSDTRFQEGSGIGLALTKELVELHHGRIEVTSQAGEGTMFTIYLPLGKEHLREEEMDNSLKSSVLSLQSETEIHKQVPETRRLENETWNTEHGTRKDAPLLLIIEDNKDMRYYLRNVLEGSYRLLEAENGKSGVTIATEKIPDLVISDVMMPEMDGYEVCRILKTDERTSHIPVILLTAKAAMENKLEGLETGADDFITKPFQPPELLARVKNLVTQRQQLRDKFRKEFEHLSLIPEKSMSSMDARFMDRARKVLDQNLSNPEFDTVEFSRQMNLSRAQLHRKLHALLNLSATTFVRTYRLNAAARLMEAKTGNVAEIAFEVGFNNLSYFSKCFRAQFGVKPSEHLLMQHQR